MYYFSVNQRPRFLYMTAQLDSLSSLMFGEHTTIAPPLHCKVFVGLGLKRGGEKQKNSDVGLKRKTHRPSAISIPREKGGNIEEKKGFNNPRGFSGKNGSLDGSTTGNGLLWVEALVGFLAGVKELGNEFDDRGNTVDPPTKTII